MPLDRGIDARSIHDDQTGLEQFRGHLHIQMVDTIQTFRIFRCVPQLLQQFDRDVFSGPVRIPCCCLLLFTVADEGRHGSCFRNVHRQQLFTQDCIDQMSLAGRKFTPKRQKKLVFFLECRQILQTFYDFPLTEKARRFNNRLKFHSSSLSL